ncbi:MAG: CAP family protein [Cyanobacteria bacterium P01_G01_bin.54]
MLKHSLIRWVFVGIGTTLTTPLAVGLLGIQTVSSQHADELDRYGFRAAALDAHNAYRAEHQSPALGSSAALNEAAQDWAETLAKKGEFQHSDSDDGENLYVEYTTAASLDPEFLANQAVKSWYDEVADYDFSNPGFSSETGHFTQVVWKSTRYVGCGVAQGIKTIEATPYNAFYVVCHYSPPGNITNAGQFEENVLPKQ